MDVPYQGDERSGGVYWTIFLILARKITCFGWILRIYWSRMLHSCSRIWFFCTEMPHFCTSIAHFWWETSQSSPETHHFSPKKVIYWGRMKHYWGRMLHYWGRMEHSWPRKWIYGGRKRNNISQLGLLSSY